MTNALSPNHVHKHGTSTCYHHCGCRCSDCRQANSTASLRRAKLKAYGRWESPYVPVEPVREHIRTLTTAGIGQKRIAALAGMRYGAVQNILYGRSQPGPRHFEQLRRVSRANADKILAITVENATPAAGQRIPSLGTIRRVRALMAIGWSGSKVAYRLGMYPSNLFTMLAAPSVTVRRAREVAELYDQLCMKAPPTRTHRDRIAFSRALNAARRGGWAPPLAWDDIDHDDAPAATQGPGEPVDPIAVELAVDGIEIALNPTERREAVAQLATRKLSDGQIAQRLHVNPRTVLRIRIELHIPASVDAAGERITA